MKSFIYKTIAIAIIAITIVILVKSYLHLRTENRRLRNNIESLNIAVHRYKTSDSLTVYKVQRLQYEKDELEKYQRNLVTTLGEMGINLHNLEHVSAISQQSYYHLANLLRDSIHIRIRPDTARIDTIHLKYIDYKSQWIDFNQVQTDDMADTKITVRDSIVIAQTWQRPHKFWFIRWGKARHYETFKNFNPYSNVKYFISIDKP
jgi:hypothetical protein